MANFSSAFRALSHGSLNWDTQLDADLLDLEARLKDSGWITASTGITAATGWSLTSSRYRTVNGAVAIGLTVARTGATLTANAAGMITATAVVVLPGALVPGQNNGVISANGGNSTVQASGYISANGQAYIANVAPSQSITSTTVLELNGSYLL